MKYFVIPLFLIFTSFSIHAQEKKSAFAEQIIIGTGFSYIPTTHFNRRDPQPNVLDVTLREYNFAQNISVSITKRLHLGFEYRFIRTTGSVNQLFEEPENFNMYGIFTQLDIVELYGIRIFGQLNYNTGNYLKLGAGDPEKSPNTNNLGFGCGLNYKFHKFFSLDFSSLYDFPINRRDFNPIPYVFWGVGVNFDIQRGLK